MSDRRAVFTASSAIALVFILGWSSLASDSPTTRPTDHVTRGGRAERAVATTQPASSLGAVEVALKRLFVIPRPDGTKADGDVRMPITPPPMDSRLGSAHAEALQQNEPRMPATPEVMPGKANPHAEAMGLTAVDSDADAGSRVVDNGPVIYTHEGVYDANSRHAGRDHSPPGGPAYAGGRLPQSVFGPGVPYSRTDYEGSIYRFGFHEGYSAGRFDRVTTERQQRVLIHARGHLDRGLEYFRKGIYYRAVNAFKLAAETNQGDPAARIYAAHSLFARGRYQDAVTFLRRAFELQPRIAMLDYDMRTDYVERRDFNDQLDALERALQRSSRDQDRLILLGYVLSYSEQRDAAYEPLAKALKNDPNDALVKLLIDNCQPPDVVRDEIKAHK